MNKKSTKRKPLTQEQIDKRTKTVFKRKIRNIFTGMGFTYVPTNDHEMVIGLWKVEIDALFIFENIWLLCEDTIKSANIKEHIRTKNEAFGEIKKNLSSFQDKLIELFHLFQHRVDICQHPTAELVLGHTEEAAVRLRH